MASGDEGYGSEPEICDEAVNVQTTWSTPSETEHCVDNETPSDPAKQLTFASQSKCMCCALPSRPDQRRRGKVGAVSGSITSFEKLGQASENHHRSLVIVMPTESHRKVSLPRHPSKRHREVVGDSSERYFSRH